MKNAKMGLLAAAAMAMSLGAASPAMTSEANHAAAFTRQRFAESRQQRRHMTKSGPGRAGHKGKGRASRPKTGWIHIGSGHRNLKKLLGTRG